MATPKYELPDDFLEAADRFATLANEMGEQYFADRGDTTGKPQ